VRDKGVQKEMAPRFVRRAALVLAVVAVVPVVAAAAGEYFVHALSASHRRPAAWQRTLCGSVRDPHNMTDIISAFGAGVTPASVWPEYPRPQLTRDAATTFVSLNGLWEFELAGALDAPPFGRALAQTILVPFPLESCLSGAYRWPAFSLWTSYRVLFDAPFPAAGPTDRTILHFGAVDWNATVYVNGQLVTTHLGGYDAFSADVTGVLLAAPASNELVVLVYDPNGAGSAPAGKQRYTCNSEPASIWYGTVSGIWQTVWLERVPAVHIAKLRVRGDLASIYVTALAEGGGAAAGSVVEVSVSFAGQPVANGSGAAGAEIAIAVADPQLWSPAAPNLYDLVVTLTDAASGAKDAVGSYAGMRTIALGSFAGKTRPALNGKPVFFSGTLDQSWWPDGVYAAPSDAGLAYDFALGASLGFNTVRAHQKHGSERWYYHADRLGVMVLQDAPGIMVPYNGRLVADDAKAYWLHDALAMIDEHFSHPSVLQWNLFNEDSENVLFDTGADHQGLKDVIATVRAADPTRLVDLNTGGQFNSLWLADVNDVHTYPVPGAPAPNATQYSMDGEYGGMGTFDASTPEWVQGGCFAYNAYTPADYLATWLGYAQKAAAYKSSPGLSSIIYTQLTDVETECDGLFNFDRSAKFNASEAAAFQAQNIALINAPISATFSDVTPAAAPRGLPPLPAPQKVATLPPRAPRSSAPLPAIHGTPRLDLAAAVASGASAAPPPGAALWLDATQVAGAADGAPLLQWADVGGGGFNVTASGAGSAPTWHARGNISASAPLPTVLFSAARHTNLFNPVFQAWAEQTLLAVVRDHGTASTCCASVLNSYNGAVSGANGISFSTSPTTNETVLQIDFNGSDEPGTTPVRGRSIVASVVYGGSSFAYINGALEASSVQSFKAAFSFTLCVGSRNNEGGDRYFDGEVGEILVYNGQLSDADHAQAVAYLMQKWAISA
jgi:hypothetical protein